MDRAGVMIDRVFGAGKPEKELGMEELEREMAAINKN